MWFVAGAGRRGELGRKAVLTHVVCNFTGWPGVQVFTIVARGDPQASAAARYGAKLRRNC